MVRIPLSPVRRSTQLLLLFGLVAGMASAAPVAPGDDHEAVAPPSQTGLRIYLDPETGAWRATPTAEQVERLLRSSEADQALSTEGLETFALRRGGRGVYLQGRFRSALVVKVRGDGGHAFSCVDLPAHSSTVGDREATSAAAPEEK